MLKQKKRGGKKKEEKKNLYLEKKLRNFITFVINKYEYMQYIFDKIEYAFTNKKYYDHVCIYFDDYVYVFYYVIIFYTVA